jgi:hypothetical protein
MTGHDLGEVTATTTEWAAQFRYPGGDVKTRVALDEEQARLTVESVRAYLDEVVSGRRRGRETDAEAAELVSRTVTSYAGGAALLGPWTVTQ